jgi:hypothetical protein
LILLALVLFTETARAQESSLPDTSAQVAPEDDVPPAGEAGSIEALKEQVQTIQSDLDKLKRFKLSGYLQVRWESMQGLSDTVRVSGSPASVASTNRERIFIRRARLKTTIDPHPLSSAVIYLSSGTPIQVTLLEAYLTLRDPWTAGHVHQATVGQFNVPFGYELERSSSVRELPERSRAENVLFPGERDRGVKYVGRWLGKLETVLGALNGPGINDPDFPNTDPTPGKDLVARARYYGGRFDAAGSLYNGVEVFPLTGPDVRLQKTRYGADTQGYYELPRLGGGTLRAEWYWGHDLNADSVLTLVQAPSGGNPVRLLRPGADAENLATDFSGGYFMWVQSFGSKFQFAARWDAYDPNVDVDHDQFSRWGAGLTYDYDGFLSMMLAFEHPMTDVLNATGGYDDAEDDLWTVQAQYKF